MTTLKISKDEFRKALYAKMSAIDTTKSRENLLYENNINMQRGYAMALQDMANYIAKEKRKQHIHEYEPCEITFC